MIRTIDELRRAPLGAVLGDQLFEIATDAVATGPAAEGGASNDRRREATDLAALIRFGVFEALVAQGAASREQGAGGSPSAADLRPRAAVRAPQPADDEIFEPFDD